MIERVAAGEVIERPASAVRELIDNALDAAATDIVIDIREGGLGLIRVADDGAGMSLQDLAAVGQRYSTSKLAEVRDLDSIETYGFRGEALASLVAVAGVTITSALSGEQQGFRRVFFDDVGSPLTPAARQAGTTVEVTNLFQHFAARRRFLDTAAAEARRVAALVRAYALARPDVHFSLVIDASLVLTTTSAGDVEPTVQQVLGAAVQRSMIPFGPLCDEQISATGWVSEVALTRPNRQGLYVSLNGRPVDVAGLLDAVESGYRALLPRGRHPYLVLHFTAPPSQVDLCVHPRKERVLLRGVERIANLVSTSVRDSLGTRVAQLPTPKALLGGAQLDLLGAEPVRQSPAGQVAEPAGNYSGSEVSPAQPSIVTELPSMRLIGQMQRKLIVVEGDRGIYLVDQHRAHERILYEQFRQAGGPPTQQLIEPLAFEIRPPDVERFGARLPDLAQLGFSIERVGAVSFLALSVPAGVLLEWTSQDDIWQDVALPGDSWLDRARVAVACRSALRRGAELTPQHMRQLLLDLANLHAPTLCPHGSPLIVHVSATFLARHFDWT